MTPCVKTLRSVDTLERGQLETVYIEAVCYDFKISEMVTLARLESNVDMTEFYFYLTVVLHSRLDTAHDLL